MNLSAFTATAKHIAATAIIALAMFTLLASQSAHSAQTSANADQVQSKEAYLVAHMETSFSQAKQVLKKAQQQYENNEISSEEIFFITLKFYEIENELLQAKLALTQSTGTKDNYLNNTHNHATTMAGR